MESKQEPSWVLLRAQVDACQVPNWIQLQTFVETVRLFVEALQIAFLANNGETDQTSPPNKREHWLIKPAIALGDAIREIGDPVEFKGWSSDVETELKRILNYYVSCVDSWGWQILAEPNEVRQTFLAAQDARLKKDFLKPYYGAAIEASKRKSRDDSGDDLDKLIDWVAQDAIELGYRATSGNTPRQRFQIARTKLSNATIFKASVPSFPDGVDLQQLTVALHKVADASGFTADRRRRVVHLDPSEITTNPEGKVLAEVLETRRQILAALSQKANKGKGEKQMPLEDRASALLTKWMREGRTDISLRALADYLECHHSSFRDCPNFLVLWESYRSHVAKGYRDRRTGRIEVDDDF